MSKMNIWQVFVCKCEAPINLLICKNKLEKELFEKMLDVHLLKELKCNNNLPRVLQVTTNSQSKIHVFGHNSDSLSMNAAEIGVFEKTN